MTAKRFHKGYVLGDTGLIDEQKGEWFIENINSVSDLRKNWDKVIDKLNEVNDEKEKLKQENEGLKEKLCELGVSDVKINGKRIDTGLEEWLE